MFHVELLKDSRGNCNRVGTIIIITFGSKMVTILRDGFTRLPNQLMDDYSSEMQLCFEKMSRKNAAL